VATIWSWPERKQLLELKVGGWECKDISFTDDGKLLAVSEQDKGIHLFDTARGRRVGLIKVKDLYQGLAFTPDSSHLIVNERQADLLSIWRVNDLKAVGKLAAPGGVFDLDVSPDGNFLAAATGRGALVWRLKPLLG
jgi:WD40 repeat protein